MSDTQNRVTVKEEDHMLSFAYVPKTTLKVHAQRFSGTIDSMPHLFARTITGSYGSRTYYEQVMVNAVSNGETTSVACKQGDWIIVSGTENNPQVSVMDDKEFTSTFTRVQNLSFDWTQQ